MTTTATDLATELRGQCLYSDGPHGCSPGDEIRCVKCRAADHLEHQADALARAWQEGHDHSCRSLCPNPYRTSE